MISQNTIDKIFSSVRIEEIVGEYVQLKRAGTNLKGLSPFQNEKSPSFVVSPSKQIWKDFSSGKGGTAVSFLMEIENFTYPEALRYLAKKYGIEIEEDKAELTPEEKKEKDQREQLYKIHEVAHQFFIQQLKEDEGRLIAMSYFLERGLSQEIIEKFQLGYSPEKRNIFTQYALEKGYSKEILEKSGLSIFSEKNPEGVDRFRERVMFPIHSFSGRVLGFGARILKSNVKVAKYLNSPETEIYHKSSVLYGLNQSKMSISKNDMCFLVEGYMDVISMHQRGVENVVSTSGTALSVQQIRLIKRLTNNVTILFDGDNAGIKASFRSIDMLLAEEMNVRVLLFPDGEDPDSFAQKYSKEEVENFIKNETKDFIQFKAHILLKEAGNDPIKKAEAIRDIVKSVAHIENVLKQEVHIKELVHFFSLSEVSLFQELTLQVNQLKKDKKNTTTPPELNPNPLQISQEKEIFSVDALLILEEKLIEMLLKYGDYILEKKDETGEEYQLTIAEFLVAYFKEDDYQMISPLNQNIIQNIEEGFENQELRGQDFFLRLLDEEMTQRVADMVFEKYTTSDWSKYNIYFSTESEVAGKLVEDMVFRHKREWILKQISQIKNNLLHSENPQEDYQKIMFLNKIKNDIDAEFGRVV